MPVNTPITTKLKELTVKLKPSEAKILSEKTYVGDKSLNHYGGGTAICGEAYEFLRLAKRCQEFLEISWNKR